MQFLEPRPDSELLDSLRRDFVARFMARPGAIGRAPGRVNLLGEHTDHNGGLCLPIALRHSTWAAVRRRDDDVVRIHSTAYNTGWTTTLAALADSPDWAAYVAGVLWALDISHGVDVLVTSDVPIGSGLSSSAALTCAVAVAVTGEPLTTAVRRRLLAATMRAENEVVGVPTGGLDQATALFSSPGAALLLDFAPDAPDLVTQRIPIELTGHELLVIDTEVRHALVAGDYALRREECETAARLLGVENLSLANRDDVTHCAQKHPMSAARARHVLSENDRVRAAVQALSAGDIGEFGDLLNASHASLRDDFEVSCTALDTAAEAALAGGAVGARMVGGGFGGSALALVPSDRVLAVAETVCDRFTAQGWAVPRFLRAGSGAAAATQVSSASTRSD